MAALPGIAHTDSPNEMLDSRPERYKKGLFEPDAFEGAAPPFTRRDFLGAAGGMTLLPLLGGESADAATAEATVTRQRKQAIVVGAGIGGLTAALELSRAGLDVTLLESTSRPGGRIESRMFDGVAANLGSQWIIPGVNPLIDSFLARIPQQPLGNKGGGMALVWDGKLIDVGGDDFLAALPFGDKAKADIAASIVKMKRDAAALYPGVDFDRARNWDYVYDLPMDTPLWRKLETMSVADYLAEFDPVVTTIWGTRVSAGFGGTPETISALFLVGWYRGNVFFPISILKGGNDRLTDDMAAAFAAGGGTIRYGTSATAITQDARTVTVACADGAAHVADYCIVTLPAAPTRRIVKGMSVAKDASLAAIEYVPLTSIAMHVKNFPDADRLSAAMYVNGATAAVANQTGPIAGRPKEGTVILVCVTDAKKTGLPERELLEMAGKDLRAISPTFDLGRDLIAHAVKPYEVGEVHVMPGFLSKHHRVLGEPVGRVHFGGEFVSNFPTWGGAAWGGQRAARNIVEAIASETRPA